MNLETIRNLVEKKGHDIDFDTSEYVEPGYTKDKGSFILFANWNDLPKHIINAIMRRYNIEWSDEWATCGYCGGAFRTSGDSHGWKPYYTILDSEFVCGDCIKENPDDYIEMLINNFKQCDSILDLTKHGFTLFNEYENGWYPGQNDKPKHILEIAQKEKPDCEFIFSDMVNGQFDLHFALYYRKK